MVGSDNIFQALFTYRPREALEILGHSTITLTMNTYAHVMPQAKQTALDALSSTLFMPTERAS
jgi:hypothetical protein